MTSTPLTFEIPDHPEPLEAVRLWALGLRGVSKRGGEHFSVPTDLEGGLALRVFVPEEEFYYRQALAVLVGLDLWCLKAARNHILPGGPLPPLYQSGVRYGGDDPGELWESTWALYKRGRGDCEDLACARCAERLSGHDFCSPELVLIEGKPDFLYHVVVRNPDGSIEDPSRELGMNQE